MWESQISSVVEWFTSKADPVNLVLFNVQQPGGCIATFGPASVEADRAVQKVDQMVASLVQRLTGENISIRLHFKLVCCKDAIFVCQLETCMRTPTSC